MLEKEYFWSFKIYRVKETRWKCANSWTSI